MTSQQADVTGEALLSIAVDAAQAAGELITRERPPAVAVAGTKSSSTDVVTEMDRRSERLLHEMLLTARPHDGFLGEEGAEEISRSGITWVVDPIDGTVNYLYSIPAYSVCLAAVSGDPTVPGGYSILVGVVYQPDLQEMFTATRGGGAYLNGNPITLAGSHRQETGELLAQALIGTGFGYDSQRRAQQGRLVAELLPLVRDIRRFGSAALDLCYVACGRLDAYYERGLNPWDLAAGELIAREAGLVVTGLRHAPPSSELVVAARPALHQELLTVLQDHWE
ncbi:MAG: inositol monophosphatase family protein [Actinomycetota bacterium]